MILKPLRTTAAFALWAELALALGCVRPTRDPEALQAIKADAQVLLAAYPAAAHASVPQDRWPRHIASLKPDFVSVDQYGADITTKAYFDGGYGYFVPRQGQGTPGPAERYRKLAPGIYWFRPY